MSFETSGSLICYYNDGDLAPDQKGRCLMFRLGQNRWLRFQGYGRRGGMNLFRNRRDWGSYLRDLGPNRYALDLWKFGIYWENLS